ncbi:type I glutamate--ammonia ligase [Deferribacter autotrophicus]|uniref:Glutamine synthetase n=1 Tax=Deferribacter autotrophicus TaxID=500465 RepID=A0A5A8F6X1_9BACT|nr:type I glutamate--ammonia ligase [Deferribacter autotrophicus]KAA0259415.1 type I glutamate--ammonia ligase [Deferribacter autotrophicus]
MTAKDVLKLIEEKNIKIVDLRFMDFIGLWQHCSYPAHELTEDVFEEGLGFDGSSIRGWQTINASDMVLIPDPSTAKIDPFTEIPTLILICNVFDPITKEPYTRDPRYIAQKAINYLKSTGIADTAYFGPEAEFFVFDNVQYAYSPNEAFFTFDSEEGFWNTGSDEMPNLGYKIRHKEGYFPVPPHDSLMNIRNEMVMLMEQMGITVEAHHHEVATGGQCEIDIKYAPLVEQADNLLLYKYIVKNVARAHGKTATFMPKPMFADNGSGMHCHQSLWKNGEPLFAGDEYAGLSELALYYIGGIIKHARAIAAFTNPTTNSYKRLVPGFEAPVNLAYSSRNRSASIRIPMYSSSPKAKRIEVRFPDPSCNPYLAFTAMLMAGLDGIENKIDPGEPMDRNLYDLDPIELSNIPQMPASLDEALNELEKDHEFLLKGDVFTEDVISTWIEYKRENETSEVNSRPHPYEFILYFDV